MRKVEESRGVDDEDEEDNRGERGRGGSGGGKEGAGGEQGLKRIGKRRAIRLKLSLEWKVFR